MENRSVKFIQALTFKGENVSKIGSFAVFIDEQSDIDVPQRKKCNDLKRELERCHFLYKPIVVNFDGNDVRCLLVFNMSLERAKGLNRLQHQPMFLYAMPNETADGFDVQYWAVSNRDRIPDRVLNPYSVKATKPLVYDEESFVVEDCTFHLKSDVLFEVNDDIERRLTTFAEAHHLVDKDWLLDYTTNCVGQKVAYWRKKIYS